MDTDAFEYLLVKVEPLIVKENTVMREAIPAGEILAITLRYLATGETQSSIAFNFRVAQNTISGIIPVVCKAITQVLKEEMRVPKTREEWLKISEEFFMQWNFPNCIGALDGKHIKIAPPPNSGSTYWNYKHFNSIVLLALIDANMKFLFVDVGTNGRISDGGVYNKCTLKKYIEGHKLNIPAGQFLPSTNVPAPFVIVADDAFPFEENILKPYKGTPLTEEMIIFNYRLSRARRVTENAFGILANRFRVSQSEILTLPVKAISIVMAACSLHNFLRSRCLELYSPLPSLDREEVVIKKIFKGSWRHNTNALPPL
ncbi:uncharacterized protein LOC129230496 [Uloborus diversus]|uniref:uncharacterized protein LOC129230496 n=1 Tax=Uloborus diversus TaxID=327109 RepID=UPI00240A86A0|nr:uncharacterized protein LOC129230496 [Uloborus diversus]